MRVVVLGVRGQLGAAAVHEFASHHTVTRFDRTTLELTDAEAVQAALASAVPEVIINCAAYNAVDAAEDHPIDALQTNALAVRTLAREAAVHGAVLVHWSSDFVFDGTAGEPYGEDARPNPRSVYAASKLLGEWFAIDAPRAYVLRVESLFGCAPEGPPPKGSVAAIVDRLRVGGVPKVFKDRTVSPTHVLDAARAARELLERRAPVGLYHVVNSGHCTWAELAIAVAQHLGVEPRLDAVRMEEVALRAARPKYCALSNAKLTSLGIVMPPWQDAIARYVQSLMATHRSSSTS